MSTSPPSLSSFPGFFRNRFNRKNSTSSLIIDDTPATSTESVAAAEATVAATAAAAGGKTYTWEEVAEHNTEKSLWVTVRGKVYDISSWVNNHPGGKEILLLAAGRDITYAFDSYHPFTEKPTQVGRAGERGKADGIECVRMWKDSVQIVCSPEIE